MKHQTVEQLRLVAEVETFPAQTLNRKERLERWAELLERNPHWHLSTLRQTEHQSPSVRANMRGDGSPISVAYSDPMLRAAGLADDTYGEARRFFELSDDELHEVICYCHYGSAVSAATAAAQIRAILAPKPPGFFATLRRLFMA